MKTGITQNDVWKAADALLLEGSRPTIERVRAKIGRGSPNTVSPHLDAWFQGLGARIQNPAGFHAAANPAPEPVLAWAQQFWDQVQGLAQDQAQQRINEVQAAAQAGVEEAQTRAHAAVAQALAAQTRIDALKDSLASLTNQLDQERRAHAGTAARLDEARQQALNLRQTLEAEQARSAEQRELSRQEVAAADERAQATERRVGLELDRERQARLRAERKAEVLEAKAETERSAAAQEAMVQLRTIAQLSAERDQLRDQLRATQRDALHTEEELRARLSRAETPHPGQALVKSLRPSALGPTKPPSTRKPLRRRRL